MKAKAPERAWGAGWREVWTSSHGRARRYHIMSEHGTAMCRPNPNLRTTRGFGIHLGHEIAATDVPAHMRCQRHGCRQRWGALP